MKTGIIPLCEFRHKRSPQGDRGEIKTEFICQAGGGEHLGWVGGDHAKLIAACSECSIPEVLAHDPAVCYFLRPVRLIVEEKAFFPCRNRRGFFRKRYPEDMSVCNTCQFWIPRPPLNYINGSNEDTLRLQKRVREYLNLRDRLDHLSVTSKGKDNLLERLKITINIFLAYL
jgi:hypothetical protein